MQLVKRIEIIIDAQEIRGICQILDQLGATGYSVIHHVTGKGERGVQSGDDASGIFSNAMLITTCDPGQLEAWVEAIRPILTSRGGHCVAGDALQLKH